MNIAKLRQDAEKFLNEINREYYLAYSGQKDEIDVVGIYDKYSHLFDRKLLGELEDEFRKAEGDEKRALGYLREFLTEEVISLSFKEIDEEFINREAQLEITLPDGRTVSFRYADVIMLNEEDHRKRQEIDRLREKAVAEELNPILEKGFLRMNEEVSSLGFENCVELVEKLSDIDLELLNEVMQKFLDETGDMYVKNLVERLEKIGVRIEEAERHDLRFLQRAKAYDKYFPQQKMIESAERFLKAMGIDIRAGGNVRFDLEKREKKSPRAFCSTIVIPDEVVLVILPKGGAEDYRAFMHELGHALHYGHVKRELPFEFRYLGDNSVTEAYAMLFDHLPMNPVWLREVMELEPPADYLRHAWFSLLSMLRRYSAKLSYELILFSDGKLEGKPKVYSEKLTEATMFKYPETSYLYDVDNFFYCARYLRAWLLEAHLSSYLEEKFGEKWFLNRDAGEFLVKLWSLGQKLTADEIAREMGRELLDIRPMVERMERFLIA